MERVYRPESVLFILIERYFVPVFSSCWQRVVPDPGSENHVAVAAYRKIITSVVQF